MSGIDWVERRKCWEISTIPDELKIVEIPTIPEDFIDYNEESLSFVQMTKTQASYLKKANDDAGFPVKTNLTIIGKEQETIVAKEDQLTNLYSDRNFEYPITWHGYRWKDLILASNGYPTGLKW